MSLIRAIARKAKALIKHDVKTEVAHVRHPAEREREREVMGELKPRERRTKKGDFYKKGREKSAMF